jgi:hypothetical protein
MTSSLDENLLPLRASFIGPKIWKSVNGFTLWSEINQNRTFHNPEIYKHNFTGRQLTFEPLSQG